jgi:hypothetical protein
MYFKYTSIYKVYGYTIFYIVLQWYFSNILRSMVSFEKKSRMKV